MRRSIRVVWVVILTVLLWPRAGAAQIRMEIVGPGATLSPIAVSTLKNLGGDDDHGVSGRFTAILMRDLTLSGYFRVIEPQAYIEDAQQSGYKLGEFNFADWRSINADFVVKGAVKVDGGQIQLTALLFDVAQQRQMMGKTYTGGRSEVPRMARRFADEILHATTGVRGPFDSRLALVSTRGGRFKEIWIQAVDGQGASQLTHNPTINLFPTWGGRSTDHLLYVSYKTGKPALYLADLQTLREIRITSPRGHIIGGALAPDGNSIAAAVEDSGATNLFLLDNNSREIRRLTDNGGINVDPAFSADGKWLAFTSDRSGTPQIYVMPAEGGRARRITYNGNYNTTPAFSPKGDWIAYENRAQGRFDIWIIRTSGGEPRKLTDGLGSNQSPTWSPDGRYIAFSSTRTGRSALYILQVANRKIISSLSEGDGDDSCPAWSWWVEK